MHHERAKGRHRLHQTVEAVFIQAVRQCQYAGANLSINAVAELNDKCGVSSQKDFVTGHDAARNDEELVNACRNRQTFRTLRYIRSPDRRKTYFRPA